MRYESIQSWLFVQQILPSSVNSIYYRGHNLIAQFSLTDSPSFVHSTWLFDLLDCDPTQHRCKLQPNQ
jgi:hypothetical protein